MPKLIRKAAKRDSAYFVERLRKAGRNDLLAQIEAGKLTVYAAAKEAGLRKKARGDALTSLLHAWDRASFEERIRFCVKAWPELTAARLRTVELYTKQQERKAAAEAAKLAEPVVGGDSANDQDELLDEAAPQKSRAA